MDLFSERIKFKSTWHYPFVKLFLVVRPVKVYTNEAIYIIHLQNIYTVHTSYSVTFRTDF